MRQNRLHDTATTNRLCFATGVFAKSLHGKFVSVKLVAKFEGERKFVNVKELKIAA